MAIMGIPENPLQRDIKQIDANAALRRQTQLALMSNIIGTMERKKQDEDRYRRQVELLNMQNEASLERERLRGQMDIERSRVITDAAFKKQEEADRKREIEGYIRQRIARKDGETDEQYLARAREEIGIRDDQRARDLADQRFAAVKDADAAREEIAKVFAADQIAQQAAMQAELERKTRSRIARLATRAEDKAAAADPSVSVAELMARIAQKDPTVHSSIVRGQEEDLTKLQEKYSKPSQDAALKMDALNRRAMRAERADLEIQKEFVDVPGAQRAYRELIMPPEPIGPPAPPAAQAAPAPLLDPETGEVVTPAAGPGMPELAPEAAPATPAATTQFVAPSLTRPIVAAPGPVDWRRPVEPPAWLRPPVTGDVMGLDSGQFLQLPARNPTVAVQPQLPPVVPAPPAPPAPAPVALPAPQVSPELLSHLYELSRPRGELQGPPAPPIELTQPIQVIPRPTPIYQPPLFRRPPVPVSPTGQPLPFDPGTGLPMQGTVLPELRW